VRCDVISCVRARLHGVGVCACASGQHDCCCLCVGALSPSCAGHTYKYSTHALPHTHTLPHALCHSRALPHTHTAARIVPLARTAIHTLPHALCHSRSLPHTHTGRQPELHRKLLPTVIRQLPLRFGSKVRSVLRMALQNDPNLRCEASEVFECLSRKPKPKGAKLPRPKGPRGVALTLNNKASR
jgi:hypothetical protein